MSTQITIRLPDEQVAFLDAEVSAGHAVSRAAAVAAALRRDQRRRRAESDLRTLLEAGADADLSALQEWAADRPYPDLD